MAKFKASDRIVVIENGLAGLIHAVSFNSIYQQEEYYVSWDSFLGGRLPSYPVDDCDGIWELECPIKTIRNQFYANIGASPGEWKTPVFLDKSCNHTFLEYHGFSEQYKYCTLCDEKASL